MLLKGKWILAAVAALLTLNLLFHFAALLGERRNGAAIKVLEQQMTEQRRGYQDEVTELKSQLETLGDDNRRLQNDLDRLRSWLRGGTLPDPRDRQRR
jgi:hypothetical protein